MGNPLAGRSTSINAVTEAEYASAQVQALAARLGLPERFIAARLRDVRSAPRPRSTEAISDLIDLMTDATNQHQEDARMAVTWWAIIRSG
jgi:hypothetical protein